MEVSVIIPVYNASRFVASAVESALFQPETQQIILIEDGSSDHSLAICQRLAKQYTKVDLLCHPHGQNRGPAASRNLGLRAVRCEYTAFLDADDYYLPDRFRTARQLFDQGPNIDGVYEAVGTTFTNKAATQWYRDQNRPALTTVIKPVEPEQLLNTLLTPHNGHFCTDGIVVRTQLFQKTGEFDESLRMCEDSAMWIKMSAVGRLVAGAITEPVSMRRIHAANTIYEKRDHNKSYAALMARSLVKWGRRQRLPQRQSILLVDALLRFKLATIDGHTNYLDRKSRELCCLAGFPLCHPCAIRSRYYWHVVDYTLGLRRLKTTLRRPLISKRTRTRWPQKHTDAVIEPNKGVHSA